MSATWYYKSGGERVGPVALERLCAMFRAGELGLETQVMGEEFGRWVPARAIAGFRSVCGVNVVGHDGFGEEEGNGAKEIAGWLIIPAIGRVLIPLWCLLVVAGYSLRISQLPTYGRGFPEVRGVVGVVLVLWALYQVVTSLAFFMRKAATPVLMLGTHGVQVAALAFLYWAWAAGGGTTKQGSEVVGAAVTVGLVWAGVWSLYFLMSDRVRATFVK
jgi:hypothetical protein